MPQGSYLADKPAPEAWSHPQHQPQFQTQTQTRSVIPSTPLTQLSPSQFELQTPISYACTPKTLGEVTLSSEQIEELFREYATKYYPLWPLVNMTKGPEKIYQQCPLLFWTIISIASRRYKRDEWLMRKLVPLIKSCLAEIAIAPITRFESNEVNTPILNVASVYSVQALLIYTIWPPVTSSLSADSSWNTIGIAIFQAMRIGLHCPGFTNDPQSTDKSDINTDRLENISEQVKTWTCCNIIAQNIGSVFGFPSFATFDPIIVNACRPHSNYHIPLPVKQIMEIAKLEDQITKTMNSNPRDQLQLCEPSERLSLIQILSQQLHDLEMNQSLAIADTNNKNGEYYFESHRKFRINAARVHLYTYYCLDNNKFSPIDLKRGLVQLYNASLALISHVSEAQTKNEDFMRYLPGVNVITIWQTSFIIAKLSHSGLEFLDVEKGKQLYAIAIDCVAKASILKHDMAYRASGLMKNMWQLFHVLQQQQKTTLTTQIRTRMAASVFFDCLWILREQAGMIKLAPRGLLSLNDEQAIDDDDDSSEDNGKTPNPRKMKRSLSNVKNPGSAVRRIIQTIPLDPQPISLSGDGESSLSNASSPASNSTNGGHIQLPGFLSAIINRSPENTSSSSIASNSPRGASDPVKTTKEKSRHQSAETSNSENQNGRISPAKNINRKRKFLETRAKNTNIMSPPTRGSMGMAKQTTSLSNNQQLYTSQSPSMNPSVQGQYSNIGGQPMNQIQQEQYIPPNSVAAPNSFNTTAMSNDFTTAGNADFWPGLDWDCDTIWKNIDSVMNGFGFRVD